MSNITVANRYAEALFQLASEKHDLKKINEELQVVKEVVNTTPELTQLLMHPKVTAKSKQAFIKSSFGQVLSKSTLNTLYLLIERKRMDILIPMIDKFKDLAYSAVDMAEAIVSTPKPLAETEREQIAKIFAKKAGKSKLEIKNVIDPELIGGIKIRIGDHIYDGSVKAQLDQIKRQLIAR